MAEKSYFRCLGVLVLASFCLSILQARLPRGRAKANQDKLKASFARVPLHFEVNEGQADEQVKFLSHGKDYGLFLTPNETVITLKAGGQRQKAKDVTRNTQYAIRMKLVGANPQPKVVGSKKLPGIVNYFIGNDPKKWQTNVPTYAKVKYEDVYPGVDVVYYGNQQQLEYDFIVSPGVDPKTIALEFDGADKIEVDKRGDLVLRTTGGEVRQRKPRIYQDINGVKRPVEGGYALISHLSSLIPHQVSFHIGDYDRHRPLIIDPTLTLLYSARFGGISDPRDQQGNAIAVTPEGDAFVTGQTRATDFPTQNPFQPNFGGGNINAFVTRLNGDGSALVYSTYLGGSGLNGDRGHGIAVDSGGNAYVTGETSSTDFPTMNAFQPTPPSSLAAFVTKLNSTGGLVYSTYLGGGNLDVGLGIAADSAGNAYVTGEAFSTNFPVKNALQPTHGGSIDAFVTKINTLASGADSLVYSTFLGGSTSDIGRGIDVDSNGNVYVTGEASSFNFPTLNAFQPGRGFGFASTSDAFVTKLNSSGSAILYSTFLGGGTVQVGNNIIGGIDVGNDIAADSAGNAYVTGSTTSLNFPTKNAFQQSLAVTTDAFVAKVNTLAAGADSLVYSTYLGGSDDAFIADRREAGFGIAVDAAGNATVTGVTSSSDFPTLNPLQAQKAGSMDAFVTRFSPAGSLIFSTFLGGNGVSMGLGVDLDSTNNIYVTGLAAANTFPTTPGAFQTPNGSVFVAKIAFTEPMTLSVSSLSQNRGGDTGGVSIIIQGFGFAEGATVRLVRTGQGDIVGIGESVREDGRFIAVTLDLRPKFCAKIRGVKTQQTAVLNSIV